MKKRFIWFLIYLFFASQVGAVTYTVDGTNGTDAGTCVGASPSTECQTIQYVFDNEDLDPDDIIEVENGTYREQVTWGSNDGGSSGQPVILREKSGHAVIISGSDVEASWTSESLGGEDFTDGTGDTPVAYWYMEEASGTRYDETTNNEDLTDNNTVGQSATAQQGTYSADFEADNSETFSRTNANLASDFPGKNSGSATEITAGFWVRFESISGSDIVMFGVGNSWSIWKRGTGKLAANIRNSSYGSNYADSNSNPTTATWYHVVMRYQGDSDNEVALFIDGTKQTSTTTTATWAQSQANAFQIGNYFNAVYVDGLMDEAFVFNTSLSDSQISDIYNYGLAGGGGGTVYYASGYTAEPNQVFEDGSRLTQESGTCPDDLNAGEWCYDATDDYVYIRTTGDDNPSGYTIEISQRDRAIAINGISHITIDGLTIEKGDACVGGGIYMEGGAANVNIQNNTVKDQYCAGIQYYDASTDSGVITIDQNIFSNNGGCDVLAADNAHDWTIKRNTSTASCQLSGETDHDYCSSIKLTTTENQALNHVVEYNKITCGGNTDATDSGGGIWVDGVTDATHNTYVIFRYNWIKNPEYDAIRVELANYNDVHHNVIMGDGTAGNHGIGIARNVNNNEVYHNSIYNVDIGLFVQDEDGGTDCTNNTVKNNAVSTSNTRHFQAIWGGNNGAGELNVYENNNFDENGAQNIIQWGGSQYSSVATFDTAATGADNNLGGDTNFKNAASDDLTLAINSVCINAGTMVSGFGTMLRTDASFPSSVQTTPVGNRPECGAYEYPIWGAP